MASISRRQFTSFIATGCSYISLIGSANLVQSTQSFAKARRKKREQKSPAEIWMETWIDRWRKQPKAPGATLHVSRFREPMYFLTKPISWRPNEGQVPAFQMVEVPVGFVTDFASIPRPFWSLLRPDGEYTYPAIIHDYLYWTHTRSREESDQIFLMGMQDFRVDAIKAEIIYQAGRRFGGSSWEENARLKSQGEKRILKAFPEDPTVTWLDWKKKPDVFAD